MLFILHLCLLSSFVASFFEFVVVAATPTPRTAPVVVFDVVFEVELPAVGERVSLTPSFLSLPPSKHRWRPFQLLLLLLLLMLLLLL